MIRVSPRQRTRQLSIVRAPAPAADDPPEVRITVAGKVPVPTNAGAPRMLRGRVTSLGGLPILKDGEGESS